jgi:serine/threonine protein kinase
MGEVWRARDLRLNREVAIKVSAQQFTDRFEREAHAIASLNHTNICTLFDIGPNYLVMELIEGPTLAERITEGPLPVEEALTIARQIADALEAAHEKNIIHRDLKPANVKIRPDGSVKVLDFGLAKANGPETVVTPDSPTMLHTPTQIGVILGTAAYMAPEQARGKNVDKRADIWSFGVVLHEMLTGKRVFEGEDLAETLAAVVKSDPDLTTVPAKFRKLLAKCLQKDPKKRLRDIGDAWDYLGTGESAAAPLQSRFGMVGWIAAALLAVIAAGLGFELYRETRPVDRPLVRLDVDLGANVSLPSLTASANGTTVAISPDGMRLAYVSGTPPKLFTRRLDQSKATEFPGVDGVAPFFSPNSQWIGFSGGRKLNKISVEGGGQLGRGRQHLRGIPGKRGGSDSRRRRRAGDRRGTGTGRFRPGVPADSARRQSAPVFGLHRAQPRCNHGTAFRGDLFQLAACAKSDPLAIGREEGCDTR